MKVLGISCSPRKGGNTEILVNEALNGAVNCGAETEFLTLSGKDIKPCDACTSCKRTGNCRIKDDMQPIYQKILGADGIIVGTPVYFWTVAGQTKVFLDRTYALRYPNLRLTNKVAGAIAVAGRNGTVSALNVFQRYFATNHMFTADLVEALARDMGSVAKDKRGMKSAFEMGRQIAQLIKQKNKFPKEFVTPLYTFVEEKYKTPVYPVP